MKRITVIFAAALLLMTGCKVQVVEPDLTPPAAPRGLATYPGDNYVEVDWASNNESDLAGYNVYASQTLHGKYHLIGSTGKTTFIDNGIHNGDTWYYAVTAYDMAGNESDLSPDVLWETARPEGHNTAISNFRADPNAAGYDFSTYTTGPYDDKYTDIFFEYYQGAFYMDVWEDSDIQDLGYTTSLYSIEDMPTNGWSPTKDVRLIPGHTYVVWTWNNHYAKFRVTSLSSSRVVFDWAYQLQEGNTRLKTVVTDRGALTMGSGAAARKAAAF